MNSTLGECRRLAWHGARGDGMRSLVERLKLPAVTNDSNLTIHFPRTNSWIHLRGADDEKGVQAALGMPYNEIWWDEAQKIPPKLTSTIRDVLTPTLLDYRGRLRFTGTPTRNMRGLFFDITRPELEKRTPGWKVHQWSLLDNPFFGRAAQRGDRWYVVDGIGNLISGPHQIDHVEAAVKGGRHTRGMVELQTLLGGEKVAPLDSPTMRREGGGVWVYEDANLVYPVHAVRREDLCYAPARLREDGYPDVTLALLDLPGYAEGRQYYLVLGADLGYSPDPFAWCLWAWSLEDACLYEVASFKKAELDSDEQAKLLHEIRDLVPIAITVADAGGGGKQVVAGWSKKWKSRYGIDIAEAKKPPGYKNPAIHLMGADVRRGHLRVREKGAWLEEAEAHHWSSGLVSTSGKLLEDPTTPNHVLDAGLYAHQESWHHRYRDEPLQPEPGSVEWFAREEQDIESGLVDGDDEEYASSGW